MVTPPQQDLKILLGKNAVLTVLFTSSLLLSEQIPFKESFVIIWKAEYVISKFFSGKKKKKKDVL